MKSSSVLALVDAHVSGDRTRFADVARMIGHEEKRAGRSIGDRILRRIESQPLMMAQLPTARKNGQELFDVFEPQMSLADLLLDEAISADLQRVRLEFCQHELLARHGLVPINRILFDGPPGTGKTATAEGLAHALELPFLVARHDAIISSYLGETAEALRKTFDFAAQNRAVILFDEFDSFGRARSSNEKNDVGEMNRVLNVLLQLIERHRGPALVIAATNLPGVLDDALERRFDLTIHFCMPSKAQGEELCRRHLCGNTPEEIQRMCLCSSSHAQIVRACTQERKRRLLAGMEG